MKKITVMVTIMMLILTACNNATNNEANHDSNHGSTDQHDSSHEHEDGASSNDGPSEVDTVLEYDGSLLKITLKDKDDNPVTDLEVSHEKLMHVIVVSHDLNRYYHLHPKQTEDGLFEVNHKLTPGNYKVFVDIKPKNLRYSVASLTLEVGNEGEHGHTTLVPDQKFTKTVNGKTATLDFGQLKTGQPITLSFSFAGEKPEPYLGALGHVVILDEKAQEYVHVHPLSDDETKFETTFSKRGVYKIWGEFKFDGKVNVYPFVVEVRE